jgi:retrograde regulation protein 2
MSISDLSDPTSRLLNCIYRERAPISLYDALHESTPGARAFYFSDAIIKEVASTLGRFCKMCAEYCVPENQISVFATEAMRTAKNRDAMLDAIKHASNFNVEILSPPMESLFGAMGARSGFDDVNGLFMDLGGGSVQMTYLNSKLQDYDVLAAQAAQSLPYGAAKLTAALNSAESSDVVDELGLAMKKTFEDMQIRFPHLNHEVMPSSGGVTIYFCGGGFRGYGNMLMHTHPIQPYPIPFIGGFTASGERFKDYKAMLKANDDPEKVFGMSKRRREQFPAIVTVVKALVEAIPNIKKVVFCSGGNREGVLYMKLPVIAREGFPQLWQKGPADFNPRALETITSVIDKIIPFDTKDFHWLQLQNYIIVNSWRNMGNLADMNSAMALHEPISGALASVPGLTHESRALLALTMCERWGSDLGPADKQLHKSLRELVGEDLSYDCEYLGALMALLATIFPAFPEDPKLFESDIRYVLT